MGSAAEFPRYTRPDPLRPEGLGCWQDGKWEFPVKLDGLPTFAPVEAKDDKGQQRFHNQPLSIRQIASTDDRLLVAIGLFPLSNLRATKGLGVYVGPGQWTPIVEGEIHFMHGVQGSPAVEFGRYANPWQPNTEITELWRFYPSGKLIATKPTKKVDRAEIWNSVPGLERFKATHPGDNRYVILPEMDGGDWAFGPLNPEDHYIVSAADSFWIIQPGLVVRVDRSKVEATVKPRTHDGRPRIDANRRE
jgi:hypothetical protein